jgi:hypothetical protein
MPKFIFKTPKFKGGKGKRPLEYLFLCSAYVLEHIYIFTSGDNPERGKEREEHCRRSLSSRGVRALARRKKIKGTGSRSKSVSAPCSEPQTQELYLRKHRYRRDAVLM